MIEDRLGEAAFHDFMRQVYAHYQFRIIRVADFQCELESYTGRSWNEFFHHWLYGAGMTDWCVEKVKIEPAKQWLGQNTLPSDACAPGTCQGPRTSGKRSYKVTVLLHQKADYTEPTTLGFCLDGGEDYQIRIPIEPQVHLIDLPEPPTRIEMLSENRVRVEILLPCKPTQISVDPDRILVDPNPANNHWKPLVRWHFTPLYTFLEETDITTAYDRLNVTFGPAIFGPAYNDPWYTRSTIAGLRAGLYRTQQFNTGAYLGYRTDDRALVTGVDGLWDHFPFSHTQIGFNAERSLTNQNGDDDRHMDRGVVFGRYVFQYGSSLYLPPIHSVEAFGSVQNDSLPLPRVTFPGADHFDQQTQAGVHYHIDYLTPYWDPEGGFRFDATYATGVPIFGEHEAFNRVDAQLSFVKGLPDWLGPLSDTRLAARVYGAVGLPTNGEYFPLGGGELFRGFDLNERQGSLVWLASLEWRVPIIRRVNWDVCDHLVGVRNVYVAPFYDVGNAYLQGHALGPVAHALGAGLRLDLAWFNFIERTTIRFDVAKTVDNSAPWQFWFGVQHPF
jgi:hypothetical protein